MSLTITNAVLHDQRVGLRAVDGLITEISASVTAQPGDASLDAGGAAITPGLVNGHTHAAMTLLRGFGDDLPLKQWLEERIWPAEMQIGAEDVYWGARLACLEMIRSGTVRFWDMYWHQHETARAVVDAGLRAAIGQPIMEFEHAPAGARPEDAADGIAALQSFNPRVTGTFSPHALYTVSEASLRLVSELSRATGAPVQIHCSETEQEVADCIDEHGCRPAQYLDRLGLLHEGTVLAHGVWLDHDEMALVAERGSTIVTNPVSNMKLAVGRAFPYSEVRDAGIPIGIGTDGAASNNSLDLLADVKVLALLQKHTTKDPAVLPAADAWAIVTGAHAPALGATRLEVGAPADFLLVDAGATELTPGPLTDGLVYAATGAVVDSVIVDGVVLMHHRVVDGEAEVRARAHEAAERIRR